jgi:DNA-binding transcriptional LysR family regulator
VDALLAEPMVLRESGSGTRQVMEERLRAAGADPSALHVVLEVAGIEAVKGAVEAGIGVSIISRSAVEKELRLQSMVARPLRGVALRRTLAAILAEGRAALPAARALIRLASDGEPAAARS